MKKLNVSLRSTSLHSWLSYLTWQLGFARWWLLASLLACVASASLTGYWNHEAALIDAEVSTALQKLERKKLDLRFSHVGASQAGVRPNLPAGKMMSSAYSMNEQDALKRLQLPPLQSTKVSPLTDHLSQSKLKGLTVKQVDYVLSKSTRVPGQDLAVGRIEVNLNMEGTYPAVRAWLGELLYQETNIQLSAIQFQRVARDSPLVNSSMTLAVYFQEAK